MEDRNTDKVFGAGQVIGMYTILLHPQTDPTAFEEFITTTAPAAIRLGLTGRAGTQIEKSELYRHIASGEAREYLWSILFSGMAFDRSDVAPAQHRLAIGQKRLEHAFGEVKDQIETFGTCTSRQFFIAPDAREDT